MKKLSVILLALTSSKELYNMTMYCINTLLESESNVLFEIIVVESNKKYFSSEYIYPDFVKVIIPESNFNFHKFLNIGIKEATGDYIALCNNDLVFYKNWFTEIYQVALKNPKILSFSPNGNFNLRLPVEKEIEVGYKVRTHIMGWCIVVNKLVFNKLGFLDETFDFNYADNDYALMLKACNIKHALVYNSFVEHLEKEKKNSEPIIASSYTNMQKNAEKDMGDIPSYVFTEEYKFLLTDKKALLDNIKFHKKWGEPKKLYRKNKIADLLIKFNLGNLNRHVFNSKILDKCLNF